MTLPGSEKATYMTRNYPRVTISPGTPVEHEVLAPRAGAVPRLEIARAVAARTHSIPGLDRSGEPAGFCETPETSDLRQRQPVVLEVFGHQLALDLLLDLGVAGIFLVQATAQGLAADETFTGDTLY